MQSEVAPQWLRRVLRDHRDTAVLVVLLGVYLAARLLALWGLTVFTSFDTGSYAPRPGSPLLFDTVSLTGNAPRPWGVPLFYSIVGTDTARAVLQWLIGTVAWALLAIGLWANLRTLPARVVATTALMGLALTPEVYTWDFAILSEALSIELGVMALGLFAIWAATGLRVVAVALAVIAVWWTFTRPDVLPLVVVLLLALIAYAVLRPGRRRTALAATAVLLLGVGWFAATVSRSDEAFRMWGFRLGLSESTFVYRLRLQVYADERVQNLYMREFGMPGCPEAAAVAKREEWSIERFVQAYRSCPELVSWAEREQRTLPIRYMLADPGHFTQLAKGALAEMLGGAVYAAPSHALPRFHRGFYFPAHVRALPSLLGVFLLFLAGLFVTRAFRYQRLFAVVGTVLVIASGLSAVGGVLYSAGEYPRFGIQEAILMRIGLVMMVAAAVDALLVRRTQERDGVRASHAP